MPSKLTEIASPETGLRKQLKAELRSNARCLGNLHPDGSISSAIRNDILPELKLQQWHLSNLKSPDRLIRKCKDEHIEEIARSISFFGCCHPILINADGIIIDGASRYQAAQSLGLNSFPCIIVDHLTPSHRRALRLALNRQQEKGAWDLEELKLEFLELIELEFPMEFTGFETAEVDLTLDCDFGIEAEGEGVQDHAPHESNWPSVKPGSPVVSASGDLWVLGKNRLLCGNALVEADIIRLLDGNRASAVFTDPPYNVRIAGNVCGKGNIQHPEFLMASGEMSAEEYSDFLKISLDQTAKACVPGAVIFVCIDWRHFSDLVNTAKSLGFELLNCCVWVKSNAGMGSLYRSQHELVSVFKVSGDAHNNNVQLGKFGRNRSNVWEYTGVNTLDPERRSELQMHPTVKPLDMVADAILDVTEIGDIVLDPFIGSGTTIMAAQRTNRRCFGIELDPRYVDTAIRRWQATTGKQAIHLDTGLTFDEVAIKHHVEGDEHLPPRTTSGEEGDHEIDSAMTASSNDVVEN